MQFWVGIADDEENAHPSHLCGVEQRVVRIRISHPAATEPVYCPRCGSLVPANSNQRRSVGLCRSMETWSGPSCHHGRSDVACLDLAGDNAELDYVYRTDLAEYRLARAARRNNVAPCLQESVRPCNECQRARFTENALQIKIELRELYGSLQAESRIFTDKAYELGREIADIPVVESLLMDPPGYGCAGSRPNDGYIYAITNGDAVKIGWSSRHPLDGRLENLQTASPTPLKVIGIKRGPQFEERALHDRFSHHRIRGEWFASCEEILQHFRRGEENS